MVLCCWVEKVRFSQQSSIVVCFLAGDGEDILDATHSCVTFTRFCSVVSVSAASHCWLEENFTGLRQDSRLKPPSHLNAAVMARTDRVIGGSL